MINPPNQLPVVAIKRQPQGLIPAANIPTKRISAPMGKNKDDNQPLAYITPQKLTLSLAQKRKKGLNWKLEEELVDNFTIEGNIKDAGVG